MIFDIPEQAATTVQVNEDGSLSITQGQNRIRIHEHFAWSFTEKIQGFLRQYEDEE